MVAVVLQKDRPDSLQTPSQRPAPALLSPSGFLPWKHTLIGAPAGRRLSMLVSNEHLEHLTPISDVRSPEWVPPTPPARTLVNRAIDACVENL